MTIKDYMEGLKATAKGLKNENGADFVEIMAESVRIWSNNACKGYCIDAMQRAGYSREQISGVMACLRASFDDLTPEEAEQIYNQF